MNLKIFLLSLYIQLSQKCWFCLYRLQKNIFFLSFLSQSFHSKIHNCPGTFLSRGKWLTKANVHWAGVHIKWADTNNGQGVKNSKFRANVFFERFFLASDSERLSFMIKSIALVLWLLNTNSRWCDKFKDIVFKNIETTWVPYIYMKIISLYNGWQEEMFFIFFSCFEERNILHTSSGVFRASYRD